MSASSKSNGIEMMNGDCETLQEKTISEEMPKWKQEQLKRYNEKVRKEVEERHARKKREEEEQKQKWEGVPAWKASIMKKREEMKKLEEERALEAQRKEEEEKARWENLPVWKRGIYQKKGLKPVNKTPEHVNPSTNDSQVTRDEESTLDNERASEDTAEQDDCVPEVDELNIEDFTIDAATNDADEDQQEQQDDEEKDGDGDASDNDEVFMIQEQQEDKGIPGIVVEDAPQENGDLSSNEQIDDETAAYQITETIEQEDQPNGLTAV